MADAAIVLVVDDEEMIRELVATGLEDGGFTVLGAETGAEAIKIIDEQAADLGALVTDVKLRGKLSGWDVANHARTLRPDLPIVYVSGAHLSEWPVKGVPLSVAISKPFAPAQIVTAVAGLMNTLGPTPGQ